MLALLSDDTLTPDCLTSTTKAFQPLTKKYSSSDVEVADIETNGFLYELNTFHCSVIINPFELTETRYDPSGLKEFLARLSKGQMVAGHNFKGYDLPALDILAGYKYEGFCFDTLVLSRLLNPERKLHSLDAWGKQLRFHKGTFGETSDWSTFSQEMMDYCAQDVRLNAVLLLYFLKNLGWYDWFDMTKQDCLRLDKAIREGDLKVIT